MSRQKSPLSTIASRATVTPNGLSVQSQLSFAPGVPQRRVSGPGFLWEHGSSKENQASTTHHEAELLMDKFPVATGTHTHSVWNRTHECRLHSRAHTSTVFLEGDVGTWAHVPSQMHTTRTGQHCTDQRGVDERKLFAATSESDSAIPHVTYAHIHARL